MEENIKKTVIGPDNKLLIRDNKYCQLITKDNNLLRSVRSLLSYMPEGIQYSPAYKNGWSGIICLMDKNNLFFLGLLPKVKTFLQERDIEFDEEDRRKPIEILPSINLLPKLQELNMAPRDYQERIVEQSFLHKRGIVRACTGSGKSVAAALLTAKINRPTIIYVIGLDLLKQFHDLYSTLFQEKIGWIGDGTCDIKRINIASVWSIGSALKLSKKEVLTEEDDEKKEKELDQKYHTQIIEMLKTSEVHILDECHVASAQTIKKIYEAINPMYLIGMSGTPFRDNSLDLTTVSILGEKIVDVSATELIERKILPQPLIKFVSVPKMSDVGDNYHEIYKNYIVNNKVRNQMIIQQTQELLNKKYVPLVLFKQINHGNILFELMKDAGIKCEMLNGNDSLERRTEIKQKLMNKEIDVILASTIFDLGVSLEILSGLVLCGSGKSPIRSLQRIGRLCRAYPGKKQVAIVDFFDQCKYLKKHSTVRAETYLSEPGFKVFKCKEMK